MILYHGSHVAIEKPDLSFSRTRTDFGRGFYLTPIKEQAIKWSNRFARERGQAIISLYGFLQKPAVEKLSDDLKILEFDTHSVEWLDFITACRLGQEVDGEWDLVIGGVANDKVFDTLQLYFDGNIDADTAIGRLRYNKPNFQYCFKNQQIIDKYLQYLSCEVMS
ncbi:hypothetical protein AGMMS49960_10410 [Betaproteobacteria bacterium]|nr:hypothetical protein AGMMS49543_23350 [Betaproteobacteria bacterium]GHU01011.1 hypothetical protein AGMMS49960_10410 [Betaproteobacteria bacterium]GHU23856.1 hypothetical protein AGMMS50243_26020 [Betaproteobacteria bacterium]